MEKLGAGVIVDIFKCDQPVEKNTIGCQYVLFVGVVEIQEIKQCNISFLIVDQHFM